MDAKATGRLIAQRRKEKGYTQKELADKLLVTDKAVSRWETGKGLPDTALLKPLGDALDLSVGELLSGEIAEDGQAREQADRVILDALDYSRRVIAGMGSLVLCLVGAALLLSPLFVAGGNAVWPVGAALIALAGIWTFAKRRNRPMKLSHKALYATGLAAQIAALVLELLPYGAVLVFAIDPTQRRAQTYSHFDLTLIGYANFTPILTGLLTIAAVVVGIAALRGTERAAKRRRGAFVCGVLAAALSLAPLLLFGGAYMTATSYLITALLVVSLALQAVANRKDLPA